MSLTKFLISQSQEIRHYYQEHGYVIVRDVLSTEKIDRLLEQVDQKKRDRLFVFNSQDTHVPTRPRLTEAGFIENSMLNPANLKLAPRFSKMVERCLVDETVAKILSLLSGDTHHVMMQNMFFDRSTGTIEHQDHYYLDADPPGRMIAAWYALEDIQEDAGCFFVLPGSHKGRVIARVNGRSFSDHETYRKEILALINSAEYQYKSFPLEKGDVLFWHPYTVHGAYKNINPQHSRKSLTAHFYPAQLKPLYAAKAPKLHPSLNPHILMTGGAIAPYVDSIKIYLRFVTNAVRGRGPEMVMRRENYEEAI
ncbi:MAG: phytanoyl-CoA dioxygenase family protein [Cyanobacteriota bacterium]